MSRITVPCARTLASLASKLGVRASPADLSHAGPGMRPADKVKKVEERKRTRKKEIKSNDPQLQLARGAGQQHNSLASTRLGHARNRSARERVDV